MNAGSCVSTWNLCGYGVSPRSLRAKTLLIRFAVYCVASSSPSSSSSDFFFSTLGAAAAAAALFASFSAFAFAVAAAFRRFLYSLNRFVRVSAVDQGRSVGWRSAPWDGGRSTTTSPSTRRRERSSLSIKRKKKRSRFADWKREGGRRRRERETRSDRSRVRERRRLPSRVHAVRLVNRLTLASHTHASAFESRASASAVPRPEDRHARTTQVRLKNWMARTSC